MAYIINITISSKTISKAIRIIIIIRIIKKLFSIRCY